MASQKIWTLCLFLAITSVIADAQQPAALKANPCYQKNTCHDCIQTPSCAWCSNPDFKEKNRCFDPTISTACPKASIYNPDNVQQILENKPLSRPHAAGAAGVGYGYQESVSWKKGSSSHSGSFAQGEIVQIQPQHLKLRLRPHQTYQVEMSYTQAEDYPVDLYYLMDLSKSMADDKDKLSELGNLLAESMMNITSNFRLGFGSFVDKVVMPYVSVVPKKLREPCTNCEAPYGYRNHMALSTNTSQFSHMVRAAAVSGNLDAPEGGFDAIMQAVVCNEQIGWRAQARRLLVFSTDAGFHYAGDGKLGGIVKPNDGRCHLDTRGMYTHSSLQDYPSISQINLKVKEKGINIIFAVTEEQVSVYEKLKTHIEGASSGKLSNDSSNIVELVKHQYEEISSTVEMKHEAASFININYFTKCQAGELQNTNKCGNIKVGDVIKFQINIEATSCPKDRDQWKQSIRIYPVGVGIKESLIIDLELLCGCDCELPGHPDYEESSSKCGENGIYKCGICECFPGFYGHKCECNNAQQKADESRCRPDNSSTVDCSGRGSCVCGKCECNTRSDLEIIYGDFCECDNFSCERHTGELCSGNGECNCGKCECKPGWTGNNCACKNTTDTCYAPNGNGEICFGNGECVCGECQCFTMKDGGTYSGKYCDKCPTCPNQCLEYKDCVQCQMYKKGKYNDTECPLQCTKFVPESVDVAKVRSNEENLCTYYDEDDCRFSYIYAIENNNVKIRAQQELECPPKVFLLGIVLGVIAIIVLIGLAILLLWKLLTTIHDRREFAKFEKERMMAKWDTGENPIYKQATSTFKNPTYAGKS